MSDVLSRDDESKKVTLQFSPAAYEELQRLQKATGLTAVEVLNKGFGLMRVYVDAHQKGQQLMIINPDDRNEEYFVQLPFSVQP